MSEPNVPHEILTSTPVMVAVGEARLRFPMDQQANLRRLIRAAAIEQVLNETPGGPGLLKDVGWRLQLTPLQLLNLELVEKAFSQAFEEWRKRLS